MNNPLNEFIGVLQRELGSAPDHLEPEQMTRFDEQGKPRGNKNCWAVLYLDGRPAGAYGNWRTDFNATWVAGGRESMTPAERQALKARMQAERLRREAERHQQHQQAAQSALEQWLETNPATADHTYLTIKRIQPGIARQDSRGRLVLPLVDFEGEVTSLQFIEVNGSKRFLPGGRKKGAFIPVRQSNNATTTLISEGWATGQTLAEQHPQARVLAALDAGNLKPVALGARRTWPHSTLVICADDDRQSEHNTGRIKGRDAAIASGGLLALPEWPEGAPEDLTDFNDLDCWLKKTGVLYA